MTRNTFNKLKIGDKVWLKSPSVIGTISHITGRDYEDTRVISVKVTWEDGHVSGLLAADACITNKAN